jgi:hypothetical protein
MAKIKKKIKKALKMAVPIIGAAMAGKALMGRRNRNAMINSATSNDGFINAPKIMQMPDTPLITDDGFITRNNPFGEGGAKKGGSAGRKKRSTITGVAVRGFGRALKGKK